MNLNQTYGLGLLVRRIMKLKSNPKRYFNYGIFRLLQIVSRTQATRFYHGVMTGEKLDLVNPRTFSHKLQWLKLYEKNPLKTQCADKYRVREYVSDCGYSDILNNLIFVCESTAEIDWDSLPAAFVLKCNHGSGFNIICPDKKMLDREDTIDKLNKWLKVDFGRAFCEPHYSPIRRKIICEDYLKSDAGLLPLDYKVFCFNGKPEYVVVIADRASNRTFSSVDISWNRVDVFKDEITSDSLAKKPHNLSRMLECAEVLAKPFAFVRVDFYDIKERIIFGEMTFTPTMCMSSDYTDFGQQLFGSMIELPHTLSKEG